MRAGSQAGARICYHQGPRPVSPDPPEGLCPSSLSPPSFVLRPPQSGEVGRLVHPPIQESSGLVASRTHPGVFWTHNDSGNPPRLFAVRADGSLIREYVVGAPNVDWEDIAADDKGRLYIGEIGNNGGLLPLRAVYRVEEPDPTAKAEGPLPALPVDLGRLLSVRGGRPV